MFEGIFREEAFIGEGRLLKIHKSRGRLFEKRRLFERRRLFGKIRYVRSTLFSGRPLNMITQTPN